MLTLCLTLQQPSSQQQSQSQQRRVVLEFSPDATVQELRHAAQQAFVLVDDTTTTTTSSVELYAGFPPRRLDNNSEMSLRDVGLQHQDRIGVTLRCLNDKANATITTNTTATATNTTQRSRRSAAVAATKRIAHEIQQEQQIQQQSVPASTQSTKTKGKATAKATKSKNTTTSTTSTARHVAALATTVSTSSSSSPRRLRDGAVVSATTNNNNKKRRQQLPEDDNDGNLLEALVGNSTSRNSNSSSALLLRRGWRAAVQSVYEQNQAAARVATRLDQIVWQSQQPSPNINNKNNDEPTPQTTCWWNVSYPKGVQGRPQRQRHMIKDNNNNNNSNNYPFSSSSSTYTDVNVPVLDVTVLHAVVPPIHARHPEGLRPENLALLSPRVLWSLVHLYQQQSAQSHDDINDTSTNTSTVGEIIPQALRQLQPHLDWSFLRRRPVTLSAKARENLRQQQEKQSSQQQQDDDDDDHWEAAATAMQAVERALRGEEEEETNATILIRTTITNNNNNNNNNNDTMLPKAWTVSTPDEVDDDELLECVHAAAVPEPQPLLPQEDAAVTSLSFSCESIVLALHELDIHNWRELANVELQNEEQDNDDNDNDVDVNDNRQENDFYTRLLQVLEQQHQQLQPTTGEANNNNNTIPVSRITVQAWIDCAQFQSVQEIMVECCENHVDAVDVLLDTVRCGTPRDLILWQTIVPVLQREIRVRWRRRNKEKEEEEEDALDYWLHRLPVWCHRAQCALEQLPWLRQYVTPIVTDDDNDNEPH